MRIDEALLQKLEAHPAIVAIQREDAEAVAAERRRLAAERTAIRAAHEAARPALARALAVAAGAASRAHDEWRALADKAHAAEAALASADHSAGSACERIDAALRATAPVAIARFVAALDAELEAVRREPPIAEIRAVLDFGEPAQIVGNSYAALNRWIVRAVEMRGAAERLAVEDLDAGQLAERFAALRAALGPIPGRAEAEVRDPALAPALRRQLERPLAS